MSTNMFVYILVCVCSCFIIRSMFEYTEVWCFYCMIDCPVDLSWILPVPSNTRERSQIQSPHKSLPDPWKGQFSWNWKSLISEISHQVDQIGPLILLKLFLACHMLHISITSLCPTYHWHHPKKARPQFWRTTFVCHLPFFRGSSLIIRPLQVSQAMPLNSWVLQLVPPCMSQWQWQAADGDM